MADVNKRTYRSEGRAQRAAATRSAILDAALHLFEAGGYIRTTTAAIAARAGVSEAMVFAAFRSKAGVLQALIDRAVVAGDGPERLADTARWSEAAEAPDPRVALGRFAALTADIQARTWRLIDLSRTASDGDPTMAAMLRDGAAHRRADCRRFAEQALSTHRPTLTFDEAVDVLWACSSADVYRLLVDGAGWTHDRYTAWLSDTLIATLL